MIMTTPTGHNTLKKEVFLAVKEYISSRVPWSTEPSLKFKTEEVGIDFNDFIAGLKDGKSDIEMAGEFNVTEKLIYHLRDHFMRYGLGHVMGQD